MRRLLGFVLILGLVAAPSFASASADRSAAKKASGSLELVGHDPLLDRGMNAALAVHGDYAYVGSRTDAKANNANHAGVLVVDISDPAKPEVVHEIGPPEQGNEGETSREMRVWPEKDLLIVMNLGSNCSELIHGCSPRSVEDNFRFYDISGENAAKPKLVGEYLPSNNPHEFFLWDDPKKAGRALLYMSTPGGDKQMLVGQIAKNPDSGEVSVEELGEFSFGAEDRLHAVSLSNDGTRAYLSHLEGGFLVIDTTDFAKGAREPQIRVLTPPANAPKWPEALGPGLHSTVKMFGKDYALLTDEVYGEALRPLDSGGCPWGWTRIVDMKDPAKPKVVAEYKLPQNDPDFCRTDVPRASSSYAAHNPTLTKRLAFISWHSGGLQAVSIENPLKPVQVAEFKPQPEPFVMMEDPALSAGQDKVVMWSYPIIKDGLIYVVDVRNGLYVLKYKGPFASEVSSVDFIEGNSNLGDALRFEKP